MAANSAFGQRFKAARLAKGLSQDLLADRLEITKAAISQWELGNKAPRFELWPAIRRQLDVDLDALILGGPAPPPPSFGVAEDDIPYGARSASADAMARQMAILFDRQPEGVQRAVIDMLKALCKSEGA